MNFLTRLFRLFVCDHDWLFQRSVQERNLRAQFDHSSAVYRCLKCGKHRTLEQPPHA